MYKLKLIIESVTYGIICLLPLIENDTIAQLANSPYPILQHDLGHTGQSIYTGPEYPTLAWKLKPGKGVNGSPVIGYDGIIYVPGQDSCVYAISPQGDILWKYKGESELKGTPTIGIDSTIYVGSVVAFWETEFAKLYAINQDGSSKWAVPLGGKEVSNCVIGSDGTIYVGSNDEEEDIYKLFALYPSGGQKWDYDAVGPVGTPSIDSDGNIYIGAGSGAVSPYTGSLYAIKPDESLKWRSDDAHIGGYLYGPNTFPVNDTTGFVLINNFNRIVAIDENGDASWDFGSSWPNPTGWVHSNPAISSDGTIYFVMSIEQDSLFALNSDGTKRWSYYVGQQSAPPLIDSENNIWLGVEDGKMYVFHANGSLRWSGYLSGGEYSALALGDNGILYFSSSDNNLYAYFNADSSIIPDLEISQISFDPEDEIEVGAQLTIRADIEELSGQGPERCNVIFYHTDTNPEHIIGSAYAFLQEGLNGYAEVTWNTQGLQNSEYNIIAVITSSNPPETNTLNNQMQTTYNFLPIIEDEIIINIAIEEGEQSGDIGIDYSISNPNNTEVSLLCEYKILSESQWQVASITGDTSQLAPENYNGFITWYSAMDLPAEDIENLMFRITPKDSETGLADTVIFHIDNNELPTIEISDLTGEQEGDVEIGYILSDTENDTISILCEYFDDYTSGWIKASIKGDTTEITAMEGSIIWNTMADLPTTAAYIKFRITPRDLDVGTSDTTEFILDNVGVPTLTINTLLTGEQAGDILFEYTISDDEKDIISLSPEYSTDEGESWHDASVTGNTANIDSLHYTGSLVWHSDTDLPGVDLLNIRFRIVPDDGTIGISGETNNFHLDNNAAPSIVLDNNYEVHDRNITIKYSLNDSEYDTLSILAEYYESSASSFIRATITGDTAGIDSSEYSGSIVWKSSDDLPDISDTVIFRVTVMDVDTGLSDTLRILPLLSVNITASRYSICKGDSLELNAIPKGGTGTYQYSWTSDPSGFSSSIINPVVSPEASTIYTVVANDGENTANKSVTITVNPLPVFEISGEDELCAYQSGEHYIVEDNPDYLYEWDIVGGDIISGAGSNELTVNWGGQGEGSKVSLTVTDSETGCILTEDFIVNILPAPDKSEIMIKGQQLLICSDSGMFSYQWYKNDIPVENQTRQFYYIDEPDLSASYYVEAILENTCRTMSGPFHLNTKSSEDKGFNNNIGSSLMIYPNPNKGIFNLVIINKINAQVKIIIRDNYGRILKYIEADKQSDYLSTNIKITDFNNGIYLIEVTFDNEAYLRKIILNK